MKKVIYYFTTTIILALLAKDSHAQKYSTDTIIAQQKQVWSIADKISNYLQNNQTYFEGPEQNFITKNFLGTSTYTKDVRKYYRKILRPTQQIALKKILAIASTSKEDGLDGNIIKIDISDKTKIAINSSTYLFKSIYFTFGLSADAEEKLSELFNQGNLQPNVFLTPGFIIPVIYNPIKGFSSSKLGSKLYLDAQEHYYRTKYISEYDSICIKQIAIDDSIRIGKNEYALAETDKQQIALDKYYIDLDSIQAFDSIKSKINDDLYRIEFTNNINIGRIRTAWFSFNSSYGKIKFKIFDDQWAFSEKLGDRSFDKWTLTASYNYYSLRPRQVRNYSKGRVKSFFISASITAGKNHVWETLDKTEITINRYQKSQNDTTLFYQEKKNIINVTGNPYDTYLSLKPAFFIHLPVFNSKVVKLNLGASAVFAQDRKPLYEPKASLLFNVLDASKDDKSLISFEIFAKVEDVFNTREQFNIDAKRETVALRTVIGINATIPFAKLLFGGKNN